MAPPDDGPTNKTNVSEVLCMLASAMNVQSGDKQTSLTCNRWRRTGNIANRTTAYNMRANTEMSSGNRDASTTDADMAALMESTDVRLQDQQSNKNKKTCPGHTGNDIMNRSAPFSGVDLWARRAVVRNHSIENEQARRKCPDRIRRRGRRQRLHHWGQRQQRQERQYRRFNGLCIYRRLSTSIFWRGGGITKHTVRGLPHLAELFRQLDLNGLPNKIPQGECEY